MARASCACSPTARRCCSRAARASGSRSPTSRPRSRSRCERAAGGVARADRDLDAHQAAPGPAAREGHPGAAAAMLGYPELRALSIKGRANYVCARRLERCSPRAASRSIFPEDRVAYAVLDACARTRPLGRDRHAAGGAAAPLSRRCATCCAARWRRAPSTARASSARRSAAAPSAGAARRSRKAHLVVANHDLLLRWPPDYPAFTHAIVDEAHELADVADEVYAARGAARRACSSASTSSSGARARRARAPRRRPRPARLRAPSATTRGLAPRPASRICARSAARSRPAAGEFGDVQLPAARRARPSPPAARVARDDRALDASTQAARPRRARTDEARAPPWSAPPRSCASAAATLRARLRRRAPRRGRELRGRGRALRPLAPRGAPGLARRRSSTSASLQRLRVLRRRLGEPVRRRRRLRGARRARARGARRRAPAARLGAEPVPLRDAHARRRAARRWRRPRRARRPRCSRSSRARSAAARSASSPACAACDEVAEELAAAPARARASTSSRRAAPPTTRRRWSSASGRRARCCSARASSGRGSTSPATTLQAVVIEKLPFEVPTELRRRRERRLEERGIDAFERYTLGQDAAPPEADVRAADPERRRPRRRGDRRGARPRRATSAGCARRSRRASPSCTRARSELPGLLAEVGIGGGAR